jgi:hypothetical protein
MFNKDNFLEASFIDNDRKNIEVLTKSDDGKKLIPTIIPYDENNHMFKELMELITIDKLHEDTHNKKKEEARLFEEQVMLIAKKSGMLSSMVSNVAKEESNDEYFTSVIDAITKKRDDEDHLFAFKIAVFDQIKEVSESDNVEGKKKIRQAKNKIELFRAVFDMIE